MIRGIHYCFLHVETFCLGYFTFFFFFNLSVHIFLEETTVHKTNFNSEWDHFKEL